MVGCCIKNDCTNFNLFNYVKKYIYRNQQRIFNIFTVCSVNFGYLGMFSRSKEWPLPRYELTRIHVGFVSYRIVMNFQGLLLGKKR